MTDIAPLTLLIFPLDGMAPARQLRFEQAPITIGREPGNTVTLTDTTVSRHHLTLTWGTDATWRLEHVPTARALYFNGEPRDSASLQNGDQIVIGQTVLHVVLPELDVRDMSPVQRTVLAPPPVPHLRVECPGIRFESTLRWGTITVGRAPGNTIIIPSPVIGAEHAVLRRGANGRYTIEAPTARNEFTIHGERTRRHMLDAGDVLVVGDPSQGSYAKLTYLAPALAPVVSGSAEAPAIAPNTTISIGRNPASELPLPSPTVSWEHAKFTHTSAGHYIIEDLGSRNGTYINNELIRRPRALCANDRIQVGPYSFLFNGWTLTPGTKSSAGLRIDAEKLIRSISSGRVTLLKDVNITIRPGEFVTIAGGSGAGKTTLLNALAGIQPAQRGHVYFDGVDSYANYDQFRGRIGYVPQRDIVHKELTVNQALMYVARLRLPTDLRSDELKKRIEQVLESVDLASRRDRVIGRLSGGEQKRVSLAVELLAEPQVLFLDEPNAALDPDLRGELQRTIRSITAQGQTVVMVTHFLEDIAACDRVAIMGRGGTLCFFGPPSQALEFFQVAQMQDVYAQTNTDAKAESWARRYSQTPECVADVTDRQMQVTQGGLTQPPSLPEQAQTGGRSNWRPPARRQRLSGSAQFWLLAQRYAQVIMRDRLRLAILLLQAPIIGAFLAIVSNANVFANAHGPFDAQKVLFLLAIVAIWFGASNAASEISKETDIYQRERLAGLGIAPYLLSKVVVLACLGAFQTLLLLIIVSIRTGLPPYGAGLFFAPSIELYLGMTLAGVAGLGMGLCVSAIASNPDKATGAVPLVLLPQIILAGIIFPISMNLQPLADITISRWAVESLGTSADLNHLYYIQQRQLAAAGAPSAGASPGFAPSDYDNSPNANNYATGASSDSSWIDARATRRAHLVETWSAVAALFVIFLWLAAISLKRKDPH